MRKYDPEIHPGTIRMAEYVRAIIAGGSVHPADFGMLAGDLAFEVNHSRGTKKQMVLNDLSEKIELLLYRSNRT